MTADSPESCLSRGEPLPKDPLHPYHEECVAIPRSFLLASGASKPWKVVPPGKGLSVNASVGEVLRELGKSIDGPSNLDDNGLCPDGECPSGSEYALTPSPRITGMVINVDTEFFTHKMTTATGPAYDYIRENFEPPYAVFTFSADFQWTSRGADVQVVENTRARKEEYDTYRYGAKFKMNDPRGVISRFNWDHLLQLVVNFKVLISFPAMIMTIVVLYCLGRQSEVFLRAQRKHLSTDDLYKSFGFQTMLADMQFKSMDKDQNGFICMAELVNLLTDVLGPNLKRKCPGQSEEWYRSKIDKFSTKLTTQFVKQSIQRKAAVDNGACEVWEGISYPEFVRSATFHEALNIEDVVDKVLDPDTDLPPCSMVCKKRRKDNSESREMEPVLG
jgi:hypothetical protein